MQQLMRYLISILCLCLAAHCYGGIPDTIKVAGSADNDEIKSYGIKIPKEDTLPKTDKNYWKQAALRLDLDLKDTSIVYPKFIKFCVDVYNWGDRTFNSYDSAYVVGTGKNWKIELLAQNWIEAYAGRLGHNGMRLFINSNVSSNIGGRLQFMAVGLTYVNDLDNLLKGDAIRHRRMEYSFTCGVFAAEVYYVRDRGETNIHRMGNYNNGKHFTYKHFNGLNRESYGLDLSFFLNHRKYSYGAAYSFSKIQKRSAGSPIVGLQLSHQDVILDFTELPVEMKQYLPSQDIYDYRFRYREYCLLLGYGYNQVFKHNWLFNITAEPTVGFKRSLQRSVEGKKTLFAFNLRGKMALIHNHNDYFYGIHFNFDGHWYKSHNHSFFNTEEDLNFTAGFRF